MDASVGEQASFAIKRGTDNDIAPDAKKQRLEEPTSPSPEVNLTEVKRQIEYYFSDENLKYDKYFHPIISADPEGWLPMRNILSCKRIQSLRASVEDIRKALEGSPLELKEVSQGEWAARRTTPPPPLEERPRREDRPDRRSNGSKPRRFDIHAAGCVLTFEGIPEEASWETLKSALETKLPPPPAPAPVGPDGKERKPHSRIQFISTPTPQGTTTALMAAFPDDVEWFKENLKTLEINGATVTVKLLDDCSKALDFLKTLPGVIKKRHEREVSRIKRDVSSKPIVIAGHTFASIQHLRKCLREVMTACAVGSPVNQMTDSVLRGLLAFHPNGEAKLKDAVSFKVDVFHLDASKPEGSSGETSKGSPGETPKSFYVVRADGSSEDFSLNKCLAVLAAGPPASSAVAATSTSPSVVAATSTSPSVVAATSTSSSVVAATADC